MACTTAEGTLLATARRILEATEPPAPPPEIARVTGLPLYRVRAGLRELVGTGLAVEVDGDFATTAAGRERLAL